MNFFQEQPAAQALLKQQADWNKISLEEVSGFT